MARWYGTPRPRARPGAGAGDGVTAAILQSNRGRSADVRHGMGGRCRPASGVSIDTIPNSPIGAHTLSTSTAKRRLAGLVSLSAVIATMVVAAAPTASLAATACHPTGFVRDGIELTAARIGGNVTGELDA